MIWSPESISLRQSCGDPDQMPHSVASDLGLHSLPMSHKKDARIIWVKKVPVGEVICFCFQLKCFKSLLMNSVEHIKEQSDLGIHNMSLHLH